MSEQWMSIVEYARTFAISDMTVRRRIKNGKLPAVLRDGKYYIKVDESRSNQEYMPEKTILDDRSVVAGEHDHMQFQSMGHHGSQSQTTYPRSRSHLMQENFRSPVSNPPRVAPITESRPSPAPASMAPELSDMIRRSLEKLDANERQIRESFESKLLAMEERLRLKDLEIHRLREQVADLQTLINMIQSKPQ